MDRTQARCARLPLRLRAVAAVLFALLFGVQAAPLLQAQMPATPDCCMAAEGKGCSMHLHRAAQGAGRSVAAVQPRCPCAAVAPAVPVAHDAVALAAASLLFAPCLQDRVSLPLRGVSGARASGSNGTRGPPLPDDPA